MCEQELLYGKPDSGVSKNSYTHASESENIYQAIIDNAEDIIFSIDKNLCFTGFNKKLHDMLKQSRNLEIKKGSSILETLYEEEHDYFLDIYNQVLKGEKVKEVLVHHVPSDSPLYSSGIREVYWEALFCPIHNNGEITGISVVTRDVNQQTIDSKKLKEQNDEIRKHEEELKEHKAQLETLIENTNDLIWLADKEGRTILFNSNFKKGCREVFDIEMAPGLNTIEELIKRNLHNIALIWEDFLTRAFSGETFSVKRKFLYKNNNSYTYYEIFFRPVYSEGKIISVCVYCHDITRARLAEKELNIKNTNLLSIIENSQDGIWLINNNHELVEYNGKFELGFTELTGTQTKRGINILEMVKKIYTPELFEDIKRRYKRVLSGEAFTIEEEKIKKGERVITETSYNPVIHEGKVIGACMFAKDVTSRKRLEKELFHSQRIESLGTLAGGIAHEINNILTPVSMLVKEIKTSDPESLEIKEIISLNASRGTELARQVLGFASPEIGRPEIIEISALIGSLEKIIKRTFPRNILLKIKNNLTGEAFTEGNKTLLNQALLNICLNARDAMPEGGSLTIQYMVTEDKNLEIKVIDQGTGIAPEIINKIFDPFFSTKEPGSGTGLGLSTVMTVIKKHNGSVKVKSESGKGTVFIILLPLYQREVIQSKNHENTAFIPTRGEEILVIDDERIIAMSVRKILEKEGYKVFTAYNGKEGLEIYRNNQDRIKLVLLDMSMPVMSGFETYNQLRNLNPGLKIIINTGLPDEVSMLNNKDIDIILKPYETELLLGKVTMMLKA